tara:strand:+ start:1153 stop:1401 length:249 start_codon:yes stop_codon:yes gene_type:complete
MSEENTTNENPVIINFNNREYKAEDLSPEQLELASLLNVVGREISGLQAFYDKWVTTNDHKKRLIEAFSASLETEEEEQEEE